MPRCEITLNYGERGLREEIGKCGTFLVGRLLRSLRHDLVRARKRNRGKKLMLFPSYTRSSIFLPLGLHSPFYTRRSLYRFSRPKPPSFLAPSHPFFHFHHPYTFDPAVSSSCPFHLRELRFLFLYFTQNSLSLSLLFALVLLF